MRSVSTARSAVSLVTFFMFDIGFGLIAFGVGFCRGAVVSWRPFLVLRLLDLLLCGGYVFVFSYSVASYGEHSSKLSTLWNCAKMSRKCEIGCACLGEHLAEGGR